jgi:hypothetical protein
VKTYFVASPRFVVKNTQLFESIFEELEKKTKLVDDSVLKWIKSGFVGDFSYKKTLEKIKKADIVVVEITGHSMSMGFVISKSIELNKPVIALCDDKSKQAFLKWMNNNRLILASYNKKNMVRVIGTSLKKAVKLVDLRFNFFVSSSIINYLDWVSSNRMIPKSVFLRKLIEKEMKKDKEYIKN